jgi:hypothetical protein
MQILDRLLNRSNGEAEQPVPVNATLMVHAGASKVSRADLALIPEVVGTDTFQPIPHTRLIDQLEEALGFRHISIERDEYAVSADGMKLFGCLELNSVHEGVRFAIGIRNANDRSMRLGMVAGFRVFCCDNMSLSGDFKPLLAKHSKNFDLVEAVSMGVDRIQRSWQPLREAIEFKRRYTLNNTDAQSIIYRAFMEQKFPVKLLRAVHREFFVAPSFEEFREKTVWSLENAFTTTFKELKPAQQYQSTAKLGKFLQPYTAAF